MNRRRGPAFYFLPAALAMLVLSATARAHSPLLDCYLEGDHVKCEAGFSDGASAAGKRILVLDATNKVLLQGELGPAGVFQFPPPPGDYRVVFEGGDKHVVTLYGAQIS